MKQIVIEHNVRGLDGTVYPSVGMTAEEYGQEIFDELTGFKFQRGFADKVIIEQNEGFHGDNACTYDVAFIQTNASIEGWIDALDERTKNKI